MTITPLNPSFLQQIKQSPAKAPSSNVMGAGLQVKKTPPKQDDVTLSPSQTLRLSAVVGGATSKASTGTQTSPNRVPVSIAVTSQQQSASPPKPAIAVSATGGGGGGKSTGVVGNPSATVVSPSKISITSLLSPRGRTPLIPTSPPIPSVMVTPSASPARTPQRTPATYGSSTRPTLGTNVTTPGTPGSVVVARPKRTGSLALFYRKMYQLAYIRIRDLCERLEVNTEFVQK